MFENFQQAMRNCSEHRPWLDVYRFASSRTKDWTYIIFGRTGPTGKTHLWDNMRKLGYKVIEITEDVGPIIEYRDHHNHYFIYEQSKCVVIILNKKLSEDIYPGKATVRYEVGERVRVMDDCDAVEGIVENVFADHKSAVVRYYIDDELRINVFSFAQLEYFEEVWLEALSWE